MPDTVVRFCPLCGALGENEVVNYGEFAHMRCKRCESEVDVPEDHAEAEIALEPEVYADS